MDTTEPASNMHRFIGLTLMYDIGMSLIETSEKIVTNIGVKSSATFNDVELSGISIHGILTLLQKFMFGLKSPETRRQYPKLLMKFLDFLKLEGTLEQKTPNS